MAKIEKRFFDHETSSFIQTSTWDDIVRIEIWCDGIEEMNIVDLDISTAVKFCKELKLIISKAKESEVNNV